MSIVTRDIVTGGEGQAEWGGRPGCFGDTHCSARAVPRQCGYRGAVSKKPKKRNS